MVVIISLLLAGCDNRPDQALAACHDLLRLIEPVMPPAASVSSDPANPATVVVRYRLLADPAQERRITCRFAPEAGLFGPWRLNAVTGPDGQPLGEAALFFLQWVRAGPEGRVAAPPARPAMFLQQTVNGLAIGGAYALLAAALSLIHALVGRIHLALGPIAVMGAAAGLPAIVGMTMLLPELPVLAVLLAAGLALPAAALLAGLTGRGAYGRLWRRPGQAPLVATLGLAIGLAEALRLAQGSRDRWLPPLWGQPLATIEVAGGTLLLGGRQAMVILATLLLWAGLGWLLGHTRFGRSLRATSDDPGMAALLGVRVPGLVMRTMALAGATAAAGGFVLLLAWGTLAPSDGMMLGLKALTAAVLGGLGSVHGAVLAGFLLGLVETGWVAAFGGSWRDVAVFALLAALLVFRREGLLGRPSPAFADRHQLK